jgi:hypothetical protein
MHTPALIYPHRQRVRTRSTAFLLALGAFVAIKLVALGAVNASADDLGPLQILDVECSQAEAISC